MGARDRVSSGSATCDLPRQLPFEERIVDDFAFLFFLLVLPGAALLGLVPARIVAAKGHSNILGWWLFGFLLFIVALPLALTAEDRTSEDFLLREGRRRSCPHCFEAIRLEAQACRHCGRDVPEDRVETGPTPEELERQYEDWVQLRMEVLAHLRRRGSMTTSEVEKTVGWSRIEVEEVLRELQDDNEISGSRRLMSRDWVWEIPGR